MTSSKSIYAVGGTVQASGGIYIQRTADLKLLELCRAGELAYILTSRQVGKSSLMVRTAEDLEKENVRSVIVDLSVFGKEVTPDRWYLGIINEIADALELKTDIFSWWNRYAGLSHAQRLRNFLRDILLKEVDNRVVLFFDEIDSTLNIKFSDDFFATLRAIYNARSVTPDFKRLSFVLIGVATPGDLISDSKRTPFNIGHKVELRDFTLDEMRPLAEGLGENAKQILERVFYWTAGHPYLTQRLRAHLEKYNGDLNDKSVDHVVDQFFLGKIGQDDSNLQFVRDMLSTRAPDMARAALMVYKNILSGKNISDDNHSVIKSHLKLSGIVVEQGGKLKVRNNIYRNVFDLDWIRETTPRNLAKAAAIVFAVLTVILLSIFIYDFIVGNLSNQYTGKFYISKQPSERLKLLANIFELESILQGVDYDYRARESFFSLTWDEQTGLFLSPQISLGDKQKYFPIVIKGLYVTFANVEGGQDSSELLQVMEKSLESLNTTENVGLQNEIKLWLEARDATTNQEAFEKYNEAIQWNPDNPATHYERARVALGLELYGQVLLDLDTTMALAQNLSSEGFEQEISTPTGWPTQTLSQKLSETPTLLANATDIKTQDTTTLIYETPSTFIAPTNIPETSEPIVEPTQTPDLSVTPTSQPAPGTREGYKSSFFSIAYIRSAVELIYREAIGKPGFADLYQSNLDSFANLEAAGFVIPPTPTFTSELPAVRESPTSTFTLVPSTTGENTFTPVPVRTPTNTIVAGGPFLLGPDISFYSDDPTTPEQIDFEKMRQEADFVIIRAGQNIWPDSDFEYNWIEAKKAGLPRGAYWYYDSRAAPEQQAEVWVEMMKGDFGELPMFADFEESYGGEYSGWLYWRDFLEQLKDLGGDKEIAILTFPYYWRDNAPSATSEAEALEYFHQYPLWIGTFGAAEPIVPKPWGENEWLFWMFNETGDGSHFGVESKGVDLNYFNGDAEALKTRFNISE